MQVTARDAGAVLHWKLLPHRPADTLPAAAALVARAAADARACGAEAHRRVVWHGLAAAAPSSREAGLALLRSHVLSAEDTSEEEVEVVLDAVRALLHGSCVRTGILATSLPTAALYLDLAEDDGRAVLDNCPSLRHLAHAIEYALRRPNKAADYVAIDNFHSLCFGDGRLDELCRTLVEASDMRVRRRGYLLLYRISVCGSADLSSLKEVADVLLRQHPRETALRPMLTGLIGDLAFLLSSGAAGGGVGAVSARLAQRLCSDMGAASGAAKASGDERLLTPQEAAGVRNVAALSLTRLSTADHAGGGGGAAAAAPPTSWPQVYQRVRAEVVPGLLLAAGAPAAAGPAGRMV